MSGLNSTKHLLSVCSGRPETIRRSDCLKHTFLNWSFRDKTYFLNDLPAGTHKPDNQINQTDFSLRYFQLPAHLKHLYIYTHTHTLTHGWILRGDHCAASVLRWGILNSASAFSFMMKSCGCTYAQSNECKHYCSWIMNKFLTFRIWNHLLVGWWDKFHGKSGN